MDADLFLDTEAAGPAGRWARLSRSAARFWGLLAQPWMRTLKVRMALGALIAMLMGMSITAWQFGMRAEVDLISQAEQREHAAVQQTATAIGLRLERMQRGLQLVAAQLTPGMLADRSHLNDYLAQQPLLLDQFSDLFLATPQGQLLVYTDVSGSRQPVLSLAEYPFFQRAVALRQAEISEPMIARLANEPVIMFVQPVFDGEDVVGVIGGSLRLASRDLLKDLGQVESSTDGTLLALVDARGHILSHPERARLLGMLDDEPRLAPAYLRWLAYDGTPTRGSRTWTGQGEVVAAATVEPVGWQVWRALPQQQFLAPLREARADALAGAAMLAVCLAALLLGYVAWQLRPLGLLERRAAALLTGEDGGEWPTADGEIGRLSRTLQHVWAERTQMESFNAEVLRKLGSVMAAAPVGLLFTRFQTFELVSEEFCKLIGRSEADLLGQPTQLIFASNEDYAALGPQVATAFAEVGSYVGEWQLLRHNGSRFWAMVCARPVDPKDASAGTIWSVNDVSDQVAARRQLEHAAHHDALTGVVNRKGFEGALQHQFDSQPASRPAALVMIDLDHFKPINDTAGHAAGDAMLVAVAQAIASRVRSTDIVVRLGGDEFALLLPHCDHERALAVAEKVRQAITDLKLTWEAHTLSVGASLGVAELTAQHESAAQWVAQADAACYEAKRAGRGTVRSTRGNLRVLAGGG